LAFSNKKFLWLNIGGALIAALLLMFVIFKLFSIYTRHNKTQLVPELIGMPMQEAVKYLEQHGLEFVLNDSIYDVPVGREEIKPGCVVDQNPIPNEEVKKGRKIYVSVRTAVPPMVEMPNLVDLSLRQAISMLEGRGLSFGQPIKRPGLPPVMQQMWKGRPIPAGTRIPKGSVIDLVVGEGGSDIQVAVPNLTGLTRYEAIMALSNGNLNLGAEIFTEFARDSNSVRVIRQYPKASSDELVNQGSDVDLWYGGPN
jgi:eukaryotic-like serine/threonine-protein kinase